MSEKRDRGRLNDDAPKHRNFKHGEGTKDRLYRIWSGMKTRCYNDNEPAYPRYGGRGITIHESWLTDYVAFKSWALSNGYSNELTIDRIDNDGNYEPGNCRWITRKEQNRNRRSNVMATAFGETKSVAEWADDPRCCVDYECLIERIRYGHDPETAITKPSTSYANFGTLGKDAILGIRQRRQEGHLLKTIAVEFNTTICNVCMIVNRKTWRHI